MRRAEGIVTRRRFGWTLARTAGTPDFRAGDSCRRRRADGAVQRAGRLGTAAAQEFEGGGVPGAPPPNQLDSWIAIGADGGVTAYTGKEEIGQGISTAQIQLVAEELCVPFDRVKLIYCDTALTPDQGVTSGSQSHPTNFNHRNLAQAAATAREALLQLASKRLGDSRRPACGGRRRDQREERPLEESQLWRTDRGQEIRDPARPERQAQARQRMDRAGEAGAAAGPAGIGHGAIRICAQRAPARDAARARGASAGVGATVSHVDESSVEGMPGVVKVVVKKEFRGRGGGEALAGDSSGEQVEGHLDAGRGLAEARGFLRLSAEQKPTRDTLLVNSKDVDEKLAQAATVVKATYHHPYQMHGSMGSSCAVADVQGEKATI